MPLFFTNIFSIISKADGAKEQERQAKMDAHLEEMTGVASELQSMLSFVHGTIPLSDEEKLLGLLVCHHITVGIIIT